MPSYGLIFLFFLARFAPIFSFPRMHFNFPGMLIFTFEVKIYFSRSLYLNPELSIILLNSFLDWLIDFEAVRTKLIVYVHCANSEFALAVHANLFHILLIMLERISRIFCRLRFLFFENFSLIYKFINLLMMEFVTKRIDWVVMV